MQNKPNLLVVLMNANGFSQGDYENEAPLQTRRKQTQSNPISNFLLGMSYGENYLL
jgi:hypothetical protein